MLFVSSCKNRISHFWRDLVSVSTHGINIIVVSRPHFTTLLRTAKRVQTSHYHSFRISNRFASRHLVESVPCPHHWRMTIERKVILYLGRSLRDQFSCQDFNIPAKFERNLPSDTTDTNQYHSIA